MSFIRKTTSLLSLGSFDNDDKIEYYLIVDKNSMDNTFKNQKHCRHCNKIDILLGTYSESNGRWEWNKSNFKYCGMDRMIQFIGECGNVENEFGTKIEINNFLDHVKHVKV